MLFIASNDNGPGDRNVHLLLYGIVSKIYDVFRKYLFRYRLHPTNFDNQRYIYERRRPWQSGFDHTIKLNILLQINCNQKTNHIKDTMIQIMNYYKI